MEDRPPGPTLSQKTLVKNRLEEGFKTPRGTGVCAGIDNANG